MENKEKGLVGEDFADALFEGVDLNHISQDFIIDSLLESPESLSELVSDKEFPLNKENVLALFFEFEEQGLLASEFVIRDLAEGQYSREQVLEMLHISFSRMHSANKQS